MLALGTLFLARPARAAITFLDDAERVHATAPLPASVFGEGPIVLDALTDEVVSFQVVIDERSGDKWSVSFSDATTLTSAEGNKLAVGVTTYDERFLRVARASGNDREGGALAFEESAIPDPERHTGELADPLVPSGVSTEPNLGRHVVFVDVVPTTTPPAGTYSGEIVVKRGETIAQRRPFQIRFVADRLPYPSGRAFTYFDVETLKKRGIDGARGELSARKILHAHGLDGVTDLPRSTTASVEEAHEREALENELSAIRGTTFADLVGFGAGAPSSTVILGMYGAYKEPTSEKAAHARGLIEHLAAGGGKAFEVVTPFIYAIDEDCKSTRAADWKKELDHAFEDAPALRKKIRVGVTCSLPARAQSADVVFMTTDAYTPVRDDGTSTQSVGVYNGKRPYAGAMVLDVPATDLLANGWISAKYKLWKWFYWESTFWLDGNRGGKGGERGFDPLTTAETFHNGDGDHQNGDGLLLYPGSQSGPGMLDLGLEDELIPSLKLKMIRRGLEDAELIAMARAKDRLRTEAIVDAIVPLALSEAKGAPSWPERGADFFEARKALHDVLRGAHAEVNFTRKEPVRAVAAKPDKMRLRTKALFGALIVAVVALVIFLGRKKRPA